MSLLQEIKADATSSDVQMTVVLRKCKILAASLGNEKLRAWVKNEQSGYDDIDECPPYRKLKTQSRGTLVAGMQITQNAPIPPATLPEKLKEQSVTDYLVRGIAYYEELLSDPGIRKEGLRTPWHPDAIAFANNHLKKSGNPVLADAWRVLSLSTIAELLDTVRNNVLDFVLEIEKEFPDAGETSFESESADGAKVDTLVKKIFLRV